jgi:hypothetical protein
MGRLGLAFSTFFKILGDAEFAQATRQLSEGKPKIESKPAEPKPKPAAVEKRPSRSEAVTLLAALQREARLVDFLQEDLSGYDDAQVGAAVRDVHRGAQQILNRIFAIQPLRSEQEGASVDVPAGMDTGCVQLVGKVEGQPPFQGTLNHHGWKAGRCDVPVWTGSDEASSVIAPAEVELS